MEINYENFKINVSKKNTTRFRLTINTKCDIRLSCPFWATSKDINNFLTLNKNWIAKSYEKLYKQKQNHLVKGLNLSEIMFLGKKYKIIIILSEKNYIAIDEESNSLYLFCNNLTTEDKTKYINNFLIDELDKLLKKYISYFSNLTNCLPGKIKIRDMSTRWGSCNVRTKNITFNFRLIHYDEITIKYVVLHELCHIKYPNHQREFWDYVSFFMPEYKKAIKLLKA